MNYSLSSWAVQHKGRIYIVTSANNEVMSLCVARFYKKEKVLYIRRMESISRVKGLGRVALVKNLKGVVCALGFPEVYIYSKPVESKYVQTDRAIRHPTQLCAYWESIVEEMGYSATRIGHREARNGMYKNALAEHRGIQKCLGRIKDEPISRAMKNAPDSRIEDIMTILCSSRDLTGGILLLCKQKEEKKEEKESGREYAIHRITKKDKDIVLNNITESQAHLLSIGIEPYVEILTDKQIPQKDKIKAFKLNIKRKKEEKDAKTTAQGL